MSAQIDVATRGLRSTSALPLRTRLRSASVWIAAAVVLLLAVIATMFLSDDRESTDPLHFDSTERNGSKALVETLRSHGVDVTTTEDIETARNAASVPDTTLLIPANFELLTAGDIDGLRSGLAEGGGRLALVDPQHMIAAYSDRIAVNDDVSPLAEPDPVTDPECTVPSATAAGSVDTGDVEYAEVTPRTPGLRACYPFTGPGVTVAGNGSTAPGAARGQLIVDEGDEVPLTVFSDPGWLSNGTIDRQGNAALVLSELSRTDSLVVYYPQAEGTAELPPSTIDFVPSWFIAGALWLIPGSLVLLLVLGRRFGPLAVERLPVIVPAVETVRGRAALSARSHDRLGALHTLRTAALLRLAKKLALGPEARMPDIILSIAARTGRSPQEIDAVFNSAQPGTDAELRDIVRHITLIESEIVTS